MKHDEHFKKSKQENYVEKMRLGLMMRDRPHTRVVSDSAWGGNIYIYTNIIYS